MRLTTNEVAPNTFLIFTGAFPEPPRREGSRLWQTYRLRMVLVQPGRICRAIGAAVAAYSVARAVRAGVLGGGR